MKDKSNSDHTHSSYAGLGNNVYFTGINIGADNNSIPYIYTENNNVMFRFGDENGNLGFTNIRSILDTLNAIVNKTILTPSAIELTTYANANHGGYLDFHFNGSTEDYTSRIIEESKGNLNVIGTLKNNGKVVTSGLSFSLSGSTLTITKS